MYVSDCNRYYSSETHDGHADLSRACNECGSEHYYTKIQGYEFGGSCGSSSGIADGRGYVSDGIYYYITNDGSGSLSPQQACLTYTPFSQVLNEAGFREGGSCEMVEGFSLKSSTSDIIFKIILTLFILGILYYLFNKKFSHL